MLYFFLRIPPQVMADSSAEVEIPSRALFKAAEVCELVKVQPYVLRSWEGEFPGLGVAKTAGGPRVYRRVDVEQVMRIKHLLLVDGLTLAGARRRLNEDATLVVEQPLENLFSGSPGDSPGDSIGQHARERIAEVKRGLRAILDLLTASRADEFYLQPSGGNLAATPTVGHPTVLPSMGLPSMGPRSTGARRKRST